MDRTKQPYKLGDIIGGVEKIPNWVTILAFGVAGFFAQSEIQQLQSDINTIKNVVEQLQIKDAQKTASDYSFQDHVEYERTQRTVDQAQNQLLRDMAEAQRLNERRLTEIMYEIESIKKIITK